MAGIAPSVFAENDRMTQPLAPGRHGSLSHFETNSGGFAALAL